MLSNSCFVCTNMLYQSGFSRESEPSRYMNCMKYPMIILDPVTHRLYYMELTHVIMETEKSEDVQSSPRTLLRTQERHGTVQPKSMSGAGEARGSSQKKGRESQFSFTRPCALCGPSVNWMRLTHIGESDLLTQSIYSRSSHSEPASQTNPEQRLTKYWDTPSVKLIHIY